MPHRNIVLPVPGRSGGLGRRVLAALAAAVMIIGVPQFAGQSSAAVTAPRAPVDSQVLAELADRNSTGFFVYLRERADLQDAVSIRGKAARTQRVYDRLTTTAQRSQRSILAALSARGAAARSYWISNVVWVHGDRALLEALATRPDVSHIEADHTYHVIAPTVSAAADAPGINAIEWGVSNIEAPRVWSEFGVRGEGVVVASIDTGVRWDHAALVKQYRGNSGTTVNHNYNWFDPAKVCGNPSLVPCDNNNHGTHVTGTMVGDDGGANQIGVAPGAKWIAAKGCESGSCSSNSLLASGQWVLAPTDLNGNNPRPDLRPDIVNNSWGGGRGNTWYRDTIRAWISAGIFPAFAAGNSGPNCNTANSPGDNIEAYAVGAYDVNNAIASFSSRGGSGVDGSTKPNIAAPGANVRSSVAGGGYSNFNGTSMATPHLSGAVALFWSSDPGSRGDVVQTKALLNGSAIDVNATGCGGTAENNNIFGEGRLNAYRLVSRAPPTPTGTLAGTVTDAAGAPLAGVTVTATGPSQRETATDASGRYELKLAPGTYSVTAGGGYYERKTVTGVVVTEGQTRTLNFSLARLPTGVLAGKVTDAASGAALAGATVTASGPVTATATTDASGNYSLTLPAGTYTGSASAAMYLSTTVGGLAITAGATRTQNFALAPNFGTMTGTVTSTFTGGPKSGARVKIFGGPGGSYEVFTDANGRYRIDRVVTGTYTAFVTAGRCFLDSQKVTIQAGQTTVHNVTLRCNA